MALTIVTLYKQLLQIVFFHNWFQNYVFVLGFVIWRDLDPTSWTLKITFSSDLNQVNSVRILFVDFLIVHSTFEIVIR